MLPSIEEQRDIVSFVESETSIINTAMLRTEREIGLLREYRTRLVADVVTGKLDVRAAKLPAEPQGISEPIVTDGNDFEEAEESLETITS